MSPRTKTLEEGTVGEEIAQALARLKELSSGNEEQKSDEGPDEGNDEEEESDEDCMNLRCFGVRLGLRGGDAGAQKDRYLGFDVDDDEDDGLTEATLAWIRGVQLQGRGDKKRHNSEDRRSGSQDQEIGTEHSRVLRHVDRSTNLRALRKRYDPDAESAYSRSTGGRSIPNVLIDGAGEIYQAKEQPVRRSRYRQHRIDMKWEAHDRCQEGVEEHRCLRASHAWRKRIHWTGVGGYGSLVRCDACFTRPAMWKCDLNICGLGICGQCREKWEERREIDTAWREKLSERI